MQAEKTVARSANTTGRTETTRHSGTGGIVLALAAVYLIWGSTYLGIRYALDGFPPFFMSGIRFILAGGSIYLFLRLRGAPNPTRKQWRNAGAIGILLLVGGNGGVTFAEQTVQSGLAAVAVATMPLWAALFGGLFGRWPRRIEWVGLAVGFMGVILLNLENGLRANPVGAFVLILAPMSWALGSAWSSRLELPSGLMGSSAEMIIGGIVLMVLSLASGEKLHEPSVSAVFALIYLIIFGSMVAYSAYIYLLGHVRPTLATSYAYVNPMVAVGLGVGLAGEIITGLGLVAMLVILVGVVLVLISRDRTANA